MINMNCKKFEWAFIGILEAIILFLSVFVAHKFRVNYLAYSNAIIVLGIMLMCALLLVYILYKKNIELHKIALTIGLLLGFVYSIYLPIGSVPDEPVHFEVAYSVSNFYLGYDHVSYKRQCDIDYKYSIKYNTPELNDTYYSKMFKKAGNTDVKRKHYYVNNRFPFQYYIPALGIAVGRILHFNPELMYMLGRIFNMIFFWIMASLAVKYMPFGKTGLLALLFMPTTLQQTMSYSYDSSIIACSLVIISLTLHMYYSSLQDIKKTEWGLLAGAGMFLLPQKSHAYILVVFFPIVLLLKKSFKEKSRGLLYSIVAILGFAVLAYFISHTSGDGVVVVRDGYFNPHYVLSHLKQSVIVFYNTIIVGSGFYLESLVGHSLGWFDIGVPSIIVHLNLFILFVCLLKRKQEQINVNVSLKLISGLVFFGTVGIVMLGMLLSWTQISDSTIQGVQGRYITPVIPALGVVLYSKFIEVDEKIDKWLMITIVFLQAMIVLTTCNRF